MTAPRILHLHSSFNAGGKEVRCVRLINAFGASARHTIVSGEMGAMGAASGIAPGIDVTLAPEFPPLQGRPTPARLQRLARAMVGYDLVLTYNFGAMDAVMAHTLFGQAVGAPPLIHHEDGFNQDEIARRSKIRNWYRRIGLGRASALVVPSHMLEAIAVAEWYQPSGKIHRIANGIDVAAYAQRPRPDILPRVIKRGGEKWLGTIAGLRPIKNLPRLVRAFAGLPDDWQLVILGEGSEKNAIRDEALRLNVAHRVHLPGFVADPARVIGLFDLFALSSDSEQFPISLAEAMAAGLAVASPAVGDVAAMVAVENAPFITPPGDEAALAGALARLAGDAPLRERLGAANRALAAAQLDERVMIDAYRALYDQAMGRKLG